MGFMDRKCDVWGNYHTANAAADDAYHYYNAPYDLSEWQSNT